MSERLFENLPLPLPWYHSVTLQDRFRQNVAVDPKITQLAPFDGVLPFQIRKPATSEIPTTWVIRCAASNKLDYYVAGGVDPVVVDMSAFIMLALTFETLDGKDVIIFNYDNNSFNLIQSTVVDGLPPGIYYMQMEFLELGFESDALGNWCSETFRVPDDKFSWASTYGECNYPKLVWSHPSDIKPVHYGGSTEFYNVVFLDTFVTASEPEYITTLEKDGLEENIPVMQKLVVKYRISKIVPDYLKIALFFMQMHDNVSITLEKQLRSGDIKNPEVSATLLSDGAYSLLELYFEQISLLVKTSCTDDMVEPDPYTNPITPTLVTGYCFATGDADVQVTTGGVPVGLYGELWKRVGAGPWAMVYDYISRYDLLTGTTVNIGASTVVSQFKVVLRTFTFSGVAETLASTPVATC